MKTLEELYAEVMASEEKRLGFLKIAEDQAALEGFLKDNGCEASYEELVAFLKEKTSGAKELSDDELEAVAGGKNTGSANSFQYLPPSISINQSMAEANAKANAAKSDMSYIANILASLNK